MDIRQMAQQDLAKLDAHIARLNEHVARMHDQLRRAEEERQRIRIFLELADRYGEEVKEEEEARRDSKSGRIRELASAAIHERSRALSIHELVAYIEGHGEEITGKDKTSYVSAVLSRDRRFSFVKDKGWSVLRPLPRQDLHEALDRLRALGAPPSSEAQENHVTVDQYLASVKGLGVTIMTGPETRTNWMGVDRHGAPCSVRKPYDLTPAQRQEAFKRLRRLVEIVVDE